jgi:hypothetical protein
VFKKFVNLTSSVVVIFMIGNCTTNMLLNLTPDEQAFLDKANAFPLEFTVQNEDAEMAWGRAQSFIGRFSSMKLQTATDYVIQTYNPSSSGVAYGYHVTKTPLGKSTQFNVTCNTGNLFAMGDALSNAHILAYYMSTGELANPKVIKK